MIGGGAKNPTPGNYPRYHQVNLENHNYHHSILADVVIKKELNWKLKIIHKTCFTITNNLLLHREQNISTSLKNVIRVNIFFRFPFWNWMMHFQALIYPVLGSGEAKGVQKSFLGQTLKMNSKIIRNDDSRSSRRLKTEDWGERDREKFYVASHSQNGTRHSLKIGRYALRNVSKY